MHRATALKEISAEGVELSENMMRAAERGRGVIMVEGAKSTGKPLRLEIIKKADDSVVTSLELSLKLAGVETMFRVINFRSIYDDEPGSPTQTEEPSGYPDTYTNGKYFAYIHGYNVDGQSARGSQSNIFKRMHQLGSKARFIGIYWNGTPPPPVDLGPLPPDYHEAVRNGFITGDLLKGALSFTGDAPLSIMAHSLGNIPASHAIANNGLEVENYFIVNGAVPLEAYDAAQSSYTPGRAGDDGSFNMARNMTEDDWKPYFDQGTSEEDDEPGTEIRLFASEWYKLFPAADNRSTLTWKNIFAKPELLNVAYNFYSPGEEVVENANETEQFGDFDNLVWNTFEARHSWVTQEIAKGGQNIAAGAGLDELNGGWEFNYKDGANSPAFGDVAEGYYKWLNPNNTPSFSRKYFSSETHEITNNELKTKPFYKPFIYPELYDPATGHDTAGNQRKRYKVLASGVPAMSYAIAANNLEAFDVSPTNPVSRNFNMQLEMKTKRGAFAWPVKFERLPEDWLHSDFKDVTIQFTHPLYEKIIELGKLNENEN